jgi:hypothetical protein
VSQLALVASHLRFGLLLTRVWLGSALRFRPVATSPIPPVALAGSLSLSIQLLQLFSSSVANRFRTSQKSR